MVCRVCKRELDSPVCSFCGEDNSAYIDNDTNLSQMDTGAENVRVIEEAEPQKKVKKYKIDYRKLIGLISAVILIIAAVIIIVSWIIPNKEEPVVNTDTLFTSDTLAVCLDGEWGYISKDDPTKFSVKPQFRMLTAFDGDIAFALIGDKYAMINKEGQLLTIPQYDSFGKVSDNGYIAVMEGGKWGYMTKDANYVINPKFSSASIFSEGVAAVSVNGAFGYIGEDGEYTIAPQYDMALEFSADGLAPIKADGKWGYVNKEGTAVIEPKFEMAHLFKDGRAKVKILSDYGVIDTEGNFLIEPQFDEISAFDPDLSARVKLGTRYGYINAEGAYIIPPRFSDMGVFGSEALTFAQRGDGKYGFINKEGKFVIEPQFDKALSFSGGLAPVLKDGLWGYVKEDGSFAIDPRFTQAGEFYPDGFAVAEDATGKTVIIDQTGNSILSSDISLSAVMSK